MAFESEQARLGAIVQGNLGDSASVRAAISRVLDEVVAGQDGWETLFGDALTSIGKAGGERLIERWVSEGLLAPGVRYDPTRVASLLQDAIDKGLAQNAARQVVETTRQALANQLYAVVDAGQVNDVADALDAQYSEWLAGRAPMIADTTVVGDWSLGEMDAAFQIYDITGAAAIRTWVTMGDDRVRTSHADADGQEVGLSEPFQISDEELMYPGDPSASLEETAGCRCWVEYDLSLSQGDNAPIDPMGDVIDPDDLPIDQ